MRRPTDPRLSTETGCVDLAVLGSDALPHHGIARLQAFAPQFVGFFQVVVQVLLSGRHA